MRWQGEIDHALLRRQQLDQWRDGQVPRKALCDADARLVAAAKFHGRKAQVRCPVCRKDNLRLVFWVFGENLGRRSGTACGEIELSAIVDDYGSCTVKEVEVCPDCRWSFLVRTLQAVREESES
ncbi:DUF5318 family protein [Corynebacterium lactis]|uniref:DUF5318 family protein n=1 Tax=Corynebacterium lactis TaxID=1231000 RepID=UPI001FE17AF6|nr:DUF5318 family protein [Corynebacterium lactis]